MANSEDVDEITQRWALSGGGTLPEGTDPIETLTAALAAKVAEMMLSDPRGLRNALYRLDVDEDRIKMRLKSEPERAHPRILAEMILKREFEKAETRRKYSK